MEAEDLHKVYITTIRPVLDFASPTYHSLLTVTQSNQIEALQKPAAKIIYGFNSSYQDIISSGRLALLSERRTQLCRDFARKASANPRFVKTWFPFKKEQGYKLRKPLIYEEFSHRTQRMSKNPVCYMRKLLNEDR